MRESEKDSKILEDLLTCVAFGDKAAFALLYDQVAEQVYGLACAMSDDPGWALELAEQALAEVWRTAPRYDPFEPCARFWVIRTALQQMVRQVGA